ncbi:hypothetical protein [Alteromonas facilis]|uniref:hypothetical protein n=1 Tax=Alteromonas facilis TaxID=2048004 RepID=UPI000C28E00C|nr:hypothetical protein [Alteromonas facilis]
MSKATSGNIVVVDAAVVETGTVHNFLTQLTGPTAFLFKGKNSGSRCRVITTLLHANEPSGFHVLHQLINEKFVPLFDTYIIVASVSAAQLEPPLTHRQLPGERDLNRCFQPPYEDFNGKLAKSIMDFIIALHPEFLIDVHNTSGSGPIFCVATRYQHQQLALASFFSRWLIHTDIELGALMEVPFAFPVITVEAGGVHDPQSDFNAYNGLCQLLKSESPFSLQQPIDILHRPIRCRVNNDISIAYSDRPVFGVNVTFNQELEKYNFGISDESVCLGWTDHGGLENFELEGTDIHVSRFFKVENGELRPLSAMKLFMATTCSDIAKSDCVFYFVDAESLNPYTQEFEQEQDSNALFEC